MSKKLQEMIANSGSIVSCRVADLLPLLDAMRNSSDPKLRGLARVENYPPSMVISVNASTVKELIDDVPDPTNDEGGDADKDPVPNPTLDAETKPDPEPVVPPAPKPSESAASPDSTKDPVPTPTPAAETKPDPEPVVPPAPKQKPKAKAKRKRKRL